MDIQKATNATRKTDQAQPAKKIDATQVGNLHMAQNLPRREQISSKTSGSLSDVAKSVLMQMRDVQDLIHKCNPKAVAKSSPAQPHGLPQAMAGSTSSKYNQEQLAEMLGLPEAMLRSVVPRNRSTGHFSNMAEAELQVCEQQVSGVINTALCGLPSEMLASTQEHPKALLDEVGGAIDHCIERLAELLGESLGGSPSNLNKLLDCSDGSAIQQLGTAGDLVQHSLQAQEGISTREVAALHALQIAKGLLMQKHRAKEASPDSSDETSSPVGSETRQSSEGLMEDAPGDTLQQHLKMLESEDPLCVLSVRKINRLGFDSKAILERHFAWHGVAIKVLVAHLRVKQAGHRPARSRPAGLGFVVMASREDALNVLYQGERQMIGDVEIIVQPFQNGNTCS